MKSVAKFLLRWYGVHRRDLPWRARPGERADPYSVWLSEIMLQQTTVAAVVPYFQRFLARWPSVEALAAAEREDVLAAWAGLGYYARARNLHSCARKVAADFGGVFPSSESALKSLPGIGDYTAAAIAAIAFGRKASPVDGNIERVVARLFGIGTPLPAARKAIAAKARELTPTRRAGDFAQGLMDLGAMICTPRTPDCPACPLAAACQARISGKTQVLPRRARKVAKPKRFAVAFVLQNQDKDILLRKRNEKGLLGGMTEVPTTPWTAEPWSKDAALAHAPVAARWREIESQVKHVFTHFDFDIKVMKARTRTSACSVGIWRAPKDLPAEALPSVMRKIIRHAIGPAAVRPRTGRAAAGRR